MATVTGGRRRRRESGAASEGRSSGTRVAPQRSGRGRGRGGGRPGASGRGRQPRGSLGGSGLASDSAARGGVPGSGGGRRPGPSASTASVGDRGRGGGHRFESGSPQTPLTPHTPGQGVAPDTTANGTIISLAGGAEATPTLLDVHAHRTMALRNHGVSGVVVVWWWCVVVCGGVWCWLRCATDVCCPVRVIVIAHGAPLIPPVPYFYYFFDHLAPDRLCGEPGCVCGGPWTEFRRRDPEYVPGGSCATVRAPLFISLNPFFVTGCAGRFL